MRQRQWAVAGLFWLLALLVSGAPAVDAAQRNAAALAAVRSLSGGAGGERALALWQARVPSDCERGWYLGLLYQSMQRLEARDQAWQAALVCSPEGLALVRAAQPASLHFAGLAAAAQPQESAAWFWLAEMQSEADLPAALAAYRQGLALQPDDAAAWVNLGRLLARLPAQDAQAALEALDLQTVNPRARTLQAEKVFMLGAAYTRLDPPTAIDYYRQGLALQPGDGVRWSELGYLLADSDPQAALEAFSQSCYLGDPGNHGCYNAGKIAESQGNILDAIRYYRLSDLEIALAKAAELEKSLK